MTNETAKAVTKATRLIPCEFCPVPVRSVDVEELAELVLDAVDETVDDMMASGCSRIDYRDMEGYFAADKVDRSLGRDFDLVDSGRGRCRVSRPNLA